mgnify:CR=1 FL=1
MRASPANHCFFRPQSRTPPWGGRRRRRCKFVRRALDEPARQIAGNARIASLMLTTDCMIAQIPEAAHPAPGYPPPE